MMLNLQFPQVSHYWYYVTWQLSNIIISSMSVIVMTIFQPAQSTINICLTQRFLLAIATSQFRKNLFHFEKFQQFLLYPQQIETNMAIKVGWTLIDVMQNIQYSQVIILSTNKRDLIKYLCHLSSPSWLTECNHKYILSLSLKFPLFF